MEFGKSHVSFEGLERSEYERFFRDGYLIGRWVRAEIEKELQFEINVSIAQGLYRREEELRRHADVVTSLRESADYDDLTGLMRRGAFLEIIKKNFQENRLRRIDLDRRHAVLFMDLDNFKQLNDGFGHDEGDKALKFVGETIKGALHRRNDFGCKWGGEEFVVFFGDTNMQEARLLAENLQKLINAFVPVEGYGPLGITIGIAEYQHHDDFDSAVKAADAVMLAAKETPGKNQIVCA